MNNILTDIDISTMREFISNRDNTPKVMVGNKIFYPYTTNKIDMATYNNFMIYKNKFEYLYPNQPYMHCRIFTVENYQIALDMQHISDSFFIFRFEQDIRDKYSVIEQEIFVLFSNPNIADVIRHLSLFEFINGLEEDEKMKYIFDEYTRYINYAQKNFREHLNSGN